MCVLGKGAADGISGGSDCETIGAPSEVVDVAVVAVDMVACVPVGVVLTT
jgi:hypothetical protein